CRQVLQTPHSF
nr:immunoglobulin light chain junction region [Macaca mulatta]MPN88576.1 immunoglobulin light chain junction region [Macaca mulatta]MPN88595.1 immunoglobulin light chain junction region [Macaca mulatta]